MVANPSILPLTSTKGWVAAMGALTAFTTVGGNLLLETIVIAGVLASFCLASVTIWAGLGAGISRFLDSPGVRSVFNWTMAALLVVSLVPVLW
jgi:threonine/homoserine/homoserine lactone efflux protein